MNPGPPDPPKLSTDQDRAEFVEQYKLFVATSESLVARRQGENRYFLTANTLVLGAIGLFLRDSNVTQAIAACAAGLALAGVVLSYSWFRIIRSYQQLNTGKFVVIHRMEQSLPIALFKDEWDALGKGEDPELYRPFTKSEQGAPIAFGIIHLAAFVLAILVIFGCVHLGQAGDAAHGSTVICERLADALNCHIVK